MLDENSAVHGLGLFFQFDATPQKRAVVEAISQINEVKEFFEKQTLYHFYSSSIIVVYEGTLENLFSIEINRYNRNKKIYLYLQINFTNVIF